MTHDTGQPNPYEQTRISPASTSPPGQYGGPPPVQSYGAPRPTEQPPGTPAPRYGQHPGPVQPQYGQTPYRTQQPQYGQAPQYAQPQATAAGPVSSGVRIIGWAIAGCAVVVAISAFLPWMKWGDTTVNGLGDSEYGAKDGIITLVLAVVAGAFGVVSAVIAKRSALHLVAGIVAVVMGLLITGASIIDIADINDYKTYGLEVGFGLWLTLVAGIALVIAGVAAVVKRT